MGDDGTQDSLGICRGGLPRHGAWQPGAANLQRRPGSEGVAGDAGPIAEKTGWWIHAYVLMGNHYHLVIETPQPNMVTAA